MVKHVVLPLALAAAACGHVTGGDDTGDDDAPASLAVAAEGRHFLRAGGQLAVDVRVERAGVTGPIAIAIDGLPAGVTASALELPADAASGQLVLSAEATVPFARHALVVTATGGDEQAMAPVALEIVGTPGALDATFGDGGVHAVAGSPGDETPRFAIAQDDRIVVGISVKRDGREGLLVVRRDRTGAADPTFGTGGELFLDLGALGIASNSTARAVAQPDGRIVIAGSGSNGADGDVFVARITADGQLDPTLPLRELEGSTLNLVVNALAIGPRGEIVIAGTRHFTDNTDGFLLRADASGSRDPGFGEGGVALHDEIRFDAIQGLAIQADGRIVALVSVAFGVEFEIPGTVLHRFGTDGVLDPSFGDNGRALLPTPELQSSATAVICPDGASLLVGGAVRLTFGGSDLAVWKFRPDGQLDSAFAGTGSYVAAKTTPAESLTELHVAEDGTIYGIGVEAQDFIPSRLVLLHLDATGAPDPAFGAAGIVRESTPEIARATAMRDDHRIVVVTSSLFPNAANDTTLRSYWR